MTSENLSPFIVYTESCSFPFSTSNLAEIGVPSRALAERPFSSEILAALRASASSARSLSSLFCARSVDPLSSPTSNALVNITKPTFFLMTYSSFLPARPPLLGFMAARAPQTRSTAARSQPQVIYITWGSAQPRGVLFQPMAPDWAGEGPLLHSSLAELV